MEACRVTLRVTFGADPGLQGAVATLIDGEPGPILDMPTFHNGTADEVDAAKLASFIREVRAGHPGATFSACIERVRAMPDRSNGVVRKMGAQSSFNFGDGFGQLGRT
jgi:crossover junction endodeoxyribonuclease RuvC